MSSRKRNAGVRGRVLRRDGYRCQKCGTENEPEVAHKLGLWAGGLDTEDNAIVLCTICHYFQPDDGDSKVLDAYLADPLTVPQRFSLNVSKAALELIEHGNSKESVLAYIETLFKMTNEFNGNMVEASRCLSRMQASL